MLHLKLIAYEFTRNNSSHTTEIVLNSHLNALDVVNAKISTNTPLFQQK